MANVQVANTLQYTSVPTSLIPESCQNYGKENPPRYNLALLPSTNSTAPFKAYMPVSMANNFQINPQSQQQCAYSQFTKPVQTANQLLHIPPQKKSPQNECVTKIILSNFDGPITVTCTDVTPKVQNPAPTPMPHYDPHQLAMMGPNQFATIGPRYYYPSDLYNSRRSQSKRKSSKKHSKSARRASSKQEGVSVKDSHEKKKPKSLPEPLSKSPLPKASKPVPPSMSAHSMAPAPNLPPPPTVEQLQKAVLRPVQPRPKPYSVETAQTVLPLPENKAVGERAKEQERTRNLEPRGHPCYCVPNYSHPYHQPRATEQEMRMRRVLDICGGVPIRVQIVNEKNRSNSMPRPRPQKGWRVQRHLDDQRRRSFASGLNTLSPVKEVSPLRTIIRPSPPPQQPLHSQGLFGMRKGIPIPKSVPQEEEFSKRIPRNTGESKSGDHNITPPQVQAHFPPPPPPPPPPPHLVSQTPTRSIWNHPQSTPKLGPKPTIHWPPRILPGSSDKPASPPPIEFGGMRRSSYSSNDKGGIDEDTLQVDGTYEVIWGYYSDSGENTDREVERVDENGETEEKGEKNGPRWRGVGLCDLGNPHITPTFEGRRNWHVRPSSGSYYNHDAKEAPRVIVKVKRNS